MQEEKWQKKAHSSKSPKKKTSSGKCIKPSAQYVDFLQKLPVLRTSNPNYKNIQTSYTNMNTKNYNRKGLTQYKRKHLAEEEGCSTVIDIAIYWLLLTINTTSFPQKGNHFL